MSLYFVTYPQQTIDFSSEKKINRKLKKKKKALDKVRVELAIHRSVDHPNIVNLIEVIDDTEEDDLVLGYFFPLSLTVHT